MYQSLSFVQYQQAGAPGNAGTLMVGARLKGTELLKAWLAVILFTLLAILINMGNLLLSYLNQKVLTRAALLYINMPTALHPCQSSIQMLLCLRS